MRKNNYPFSLVIFLLFISLSSVYSQQDSIKQPELIYRKNVLHGSFGTLGIGYSASIFYDRILFESQNRSKFTTFLRLGYQENIFIFSNGGNAYILEAGMLTGKKFSHFEGALGVTYLNSNYEYRVLPAFSIGYRGQKPKGGFMFRTGIGNPEWLYFGLGFAF
ncbi:MAG: hypothetical protein PHT07_06485 [Paludibacter sp.]|nr:hypothetical protein [Paludibacter sp.]